MLLRWYNVYETFSRCVSTGCTLRKQKTESEGERKSKRGIIGNINVKNMWVNSKDK